MKKHNEGYTLPLVMVVLLVLAIVAVTIMTTSLENMLRQQGFIEKMEDQYKAQGQIEALVGKLIYSKDSEIEGIINGISRDEYFTVKKTGDLEIMSKVGTVQIDCVIKLEIIEDKVNGSETTEIVPNKVSYTSYEIIKGGATG